MHDVTKGRFQSGAFEHNVGKRKERDVLLGGLAVLRDGNTLTRIIRVTESLTIVSESIVSI